MKKPLIEQKGFASMSPATFEEAKRALNEFIPRAGHFYSKERNYDRGPLDRKNVSLLSAAIQRRILTEKEVILETLKHHTFEASEKFIQEVLWRSYWKSWLELRPSVWAGYLVHSEKTVLRKTGIECFDQWREELRETGYLHNHARMWFASIWIFTLGLPWYLGAKLFEEELIDFDPASNTLSWRWVAGLHTPGKNYIARAENIYTFTDGRFNPEGQLNETAQPASSTPFPIVPSLEIAEPPKPVPGNWGLLVHAEDLSVERTEFALWPFKSVGLLRVKSGKTPVIQAFEDRAFQDASRRLQMKFPCTIEPITDDGESSVLNWAKKNQLEGICLIKPWQGPLLWLLNIPIPVQYFRRAYDVPFIGKARAGFFSFKEEMKETVMKTGSESSESLEKLCLMSLKK